MKSGTPFFVTVFVACAPSIAAASDSFNDLSLEHLLSLKISGASKYEQKQTEVAASVSVITQSEIKTFGWRTLGEALASLPGMYTTYDRQYTYLGARGFGLPGDYNTRVLVTVNGNRVNDPVYDTGPAGLEFPVDLDLIDRIEFIPGPGGAVYGQNAMLGVVNVVTRRGSAVDGVELAASYQNPQVQSEGRATWGKLLDNGADLMLSVSGMSMRGEDRFFDYPGSAASSGLANGLDGGRSAKFFGRFAYGPWSLEHIDGGRRKYDPTGAYKSDPLVPGQYQDDHYALTQLQYQNSFAGDTLNLSGRLFQGQYRYGGELSYGTLFSLPASGQWQGAEFRLVSSAYDQHKLMLGVEVQENSRIDQNVLDIANPANNIFIASPGYRVGFYAQDEWRITPTLTSTLGVRSDRNNVTGSSLSPRVAFIWQASVSTTVKALYGRAHRAPNAYERDYGDGLFQVKNSTLNGETIDTTEVVIDHRLGRDLTVRGSVYQWDIQNLVALGVDPVSGLSQYQNSGAAKANGIELSADKTWEGGARLRGSVAYQRTRYESGADLDNSPVLMGKLNFSAPLASTGLRLGYELQHYSERQAIDGTKLAVYTLSNLNLMASQWVKGLDVSLGLYNLFNANYRHPGSDTNWQKSFDQDGRSVRLKLAYRF